jgi:hypothetical protein
MVPDSSVVVNEVMREAMCMVMGSGWRVVSII